MTLTRTYNAPQNAPVIVLIASWILLSISNIKTILPCRKLSNWTSRRRQDGDYIGLRIGLEEDVVANKRSASLWPGAIKLGPIINIVMTYQWPCPCRHHPGQLTWHHSLSIQDTVCHVHYKPCKEHTSHCSQNVMFVFARVVQGSIFANIFDKIHSKRWVGRRAALTVMSLGALRARGECRVYAGMMMMRPEQDSNH